MLAHPSQGSAELGAAWLVGILGITAFAAIIVATLLKGRDEPANRINPGEP